MVINMQIYGRHSQLKKKLFFGVLNQLDHIHFVRQILLNEFPKLTISLRDLHIAEFLVGFINAHIYLNILGNHTEKCSQSINKHLVHWLYFLYIVEIAIF